MSKRNMSIETFKYQYFLSKCSTVKCLTQTKSPKQNDRLVKQITQLMKSSRERHIDKNHHQPSTTSRQEDNRNCSLTFHQLLFEYNKSRKAQMKENSFNKSNRPTIMKSRQISFPNSQLDTSNSRTRIKDSMYQNKNILTKISNIAVAHIESQIIYNKEIQQKIENMFRCSQEQLEILAEMKAEIQQDNKQKVNQRCVSADIQIQPPSPFKKSRSSSQDRKESRCYGSTQANSNPIDLTCDEQTINITADERLQTEPEPLLQLERHYIPDPYYLLKQPNLNILTRAILVDWMMEVGMGFSLKRQSIHLAIYYLDKFLSKQEATKQIFQLIGLGCLLIATKIEEIVPTRVADFEKAADFGYNQEQILKMELQILVLLKWEVNPPTYTHWINWFTDQWDIFAQQRCLNCWFRKPNEESYQMFRKLTQLVDCSLLDVQTLQYLPRTIVAGFMYLILAFELQVFAIEMLEIMSSSSLFLLDKNNSYNQLFGGFVKTAFGCALQDLLPAIQYCVEFYQLEIDYATPPGVVNLSNTQLENNYEEFLSFQCHSKSSLEFVRHRVRE